MSRWGWLSRQTAPSAGRRTSTQSGQTAMNALCDVVVGAPSEETALIQQLHITVGHAICHLVEREMFGGTRG